MPRRSIDLEQSLSYSSPQEEALLTLMRTADALGRSLQLRLKPYGLTPTQYNVLRILRSARPTGLTCSAIGNGLIAAEPDITRLLARLKTQKVLRQERDPHDKRVVRTHICQKGLQLLEQLDAPIEQAPQELLTELTCDEVRELTRLLKKTQIRRGEPSASRAAMEP